MLVLKLWWKVKIEASENTIISISAIFRHHVETNLEATATNFVLLRAISAAFQQFFDIFWDFSIFSLVTPFVLIVWNSLKFWIMLVSFRYFFSYYFLLLFILTWSISIFRLHHVFFETIKLTFLPNDLLQFFNLFSDFSIDFSRRLNCIRKC